MHLTTFIWTSIVNMVVNVCAGVLCIVLLVLTCMDMALGFASDLLK